MEPLVEVTLYQDTHCPYSERARRALGEKGIFQRRINIPWTGRDELAAQTGSRSTPAMGYAGRYWTTSGSIARWAEREATGGIALFPEDRRAAVAAWERTADEIVRATLPLAVPVWADVMTDAAERRAFLAAYARLGTYRELVNARMEHWRAVMNEWRKLDAVLADTDFLLGPLTYADLAVYGAVYLAAQFHAFEVPQVLERLAAWYETIRTAGLQRDQEVLLDHLRKRTGGTHDIDFTRHTTRYSDPPHRAGGPDDQHY